MTYRLGVDLGTTYSSAAVAADGRAHIVALGNRSAVIPSVVYARDDGDLLVGEAADRRGRAEPSRMAREFKRRMGDPNAFDLGGVRLRADELMAAMLPPILQTTVDREGAQPDLLALTHPANWSQPKRTLLRESVLALGLDLPELMLISEPEAAAIYYAETERIDVGEVVAVYDLGGGTFDAAVLRRTANGFDLMGPPEGIDRLGGVDFDAAVFAHVNRFLDGALDTYDPSDSTAAAGVARLRADCVEAKEALSADTDVTIPVLLPGLRTELRMTRGELEGMIRPALADTLGALQRALRAAHVVSSDVKVVLLVGGSSRIPLVAQLVGAEIGRPVAIDVHPKHAVALGAALAADIRMRIEGPTGGAAAGGVAAGAAATGAAPAGGPPRAAAGPAVDTPAPAADTAAAAPAEAPTPAAAAQPAPASAAAATEPAAAPAPAATVAAEAGRTGRGGDPSAPRPGGAGGNGARLALLGALAALIVVVIVAVIALGGGGGDGNETAAGTGSTVAADDSVPASTASSTTAPTTATTAATTTTQPPTPAECEGQTGPYVCIYSIGKDDAGNLIIPFETIGYVADIAFRHIHFFFPDIPAIQADVRNAGAGGPNPADWRLWALPNPFGLNGENGPYTVQDAREVGATQVCVLVADQSHAVTPETGNCLPIPPEVLT
jgi:actin-like ATPase involved in cell morphogenesis